MGDTPLKNLGLAPGLEQPLIDIDSRFSTLEGALDIIRESGGPESIPGVSPEIGEFLALRLKAEGYDWNGQEVALPVAQDSTSDPAGTESREDPEGSEAESQLAEARLEVCENSLAVHEAEQALDKAKHDLKLATETRNVSVARLAALMNPDPQLDLFDRYREEDDEPAGDLEDGEPEEVEGPAVAESDDADWREVDAGATLGLTVAQTDKLHAANIRTMGEFQDLRHASGLATIKGFGKKTVATLEERADEFLRGKLGDDEDASAEPSDPEQEPEPAPAELESPATIEDPIELNGVYVGRDDRGRWMESLNPNAGWQLCGDHRGRWIAEELADRARTEEAKRKATEQLDAEGPPGDPPQTTTIILTEDVEVTLGLAASTTWTVKQRLRDGKVVVMTHDDTPYVIRPEEYEVFEQ